MKRKLIFLAFGFAVTFAIGVVAGGVIFGNGTSPHDDLINWFTDEVAVEECTGDCFAAYDDFSIKRNGAEVILGDLLTMNRNNSFRFKEYKKDASWEVTSRIDAIMGAATEGAKSEGDYSVSLFRASDVQVSAQIINSTDAEIAKFNIGDPISLKCGSVSIPIGNAISFDDCIVNKDKSQ